MITSHAVRFVLVQPSCKLPRSETDANMALGLARLDWIPCQTREQSLSWIICSCTGEIFPDNDPTVEPQCSTPTSAVSRSEDDISFTRLQALSGRVTIWKEGWPGLDWKLIVQNLMCVCWPQGVSLCHNVRNRDQWRYLDILVSELQLIWWIVSRSIWAACHWWL